MRILVKHVMRILVQHVMLSQVYLDDKSNVTSEDKSSVIFDEKSSVKCNEKYSVTCHNKSSVTFDEKYNVTCKYKYSVTNDRYSLCPVTDYMTLLGLLLGTQPKFGLQGSWVKVDQICIWVSITISQNATVHDVYFNKNSFYINFLIFIFSIIFT